MESSAAASPGAVRRAGALRRSRAVRRAGAVRRVALPGARTLVVRPMEHRDVAGLVALFARLSEEDLYRRFFSARPPPEHFVREMADIGRRGGAGLVAVMTGRAGPAGDAPGGGDRLVAEATFSPLADGDGELGITVAPEARGWLGPYLLDALLEVAAEKGVANLQADVLLTNARMLAMLRRRGCAVLGFEERPAIIRVAVGAASRFPTWATASTQRRVLVEVPGGRWPAQGTVAAAGYRVMACAGPPGGWEACPALRGEPCPLAAGADVVVCAVPGEIGRALLAAHRTVHPRPRRCAEVGPTGTGPGPDADLTLIPRGTPPEAVADVVRKLAPSQ